MATLVGKNGHQKHSDNVRLKCVLKTKHTIDFTNRDSLLVYDECLYREVVFMYTVISLQRKPHTPCEALYQISHHPFLRITMR